MLALFGYPAFAAKLALILEVPVFVPVSQNARTMCYPAPQPAHAHASRLLDCTAEKYGTVLFVG
jgi:hypothetical protein